MAELGEMVNVVAFGDDEWKCPFSHDDMKHDKKNVLPPPKEKNNAATLSRNLDKKKMHIEDISIQFNSNGKSFKQKVHFSAHHLIPGNEAWSAGKNQLRKWIDKDKGHVKGDIGYDVNDASNGVDLPGHGSLSDWSTNGIQYQVDYAFTGIEAQRYRQFHDRHPAYSDFVVNVLNKIAAKLDRQPSPGCGEDKCGGGSKSPKYDPPYNLSGRLENTARRLEGYLTGDWKKWKKPIMTSRFSLMYQDRSLTQDEARKQLKKKQFIYKS